MRRRLGAGWVAIALLNSSACSAILGIEPGILDEDAGNAGTTSSGGSSGSGSGGTAGTSGTSGTGGSSGSGGDASIDGASGTGGGPDGDASELDANGDGSSDGSACSAGPDTAHAIFVSLGGSADSTVCGSPDVPCKTINLGIQRAVALARSVVYVNVGTYNESVQLAAGVAVEGGWNQLGVSWSRDCGAHPEALAVIAPTVATRAVVAMDLKGTATLRTLTIHSKTGATDGTGHGESVYGVFATSSGAGTPTTVNLEGVAVLANKAGDGSTGGTPGTPAQASNGCAPAETGANASPNSNVGTGSPAGSFSIAGYTPHDGSTGPVGSVGGNGTSLPGSTVDCWTCTSGSCAGSAPNGMTSTGEPGIPGCGGLGGGGGLAGKGGGASVGVFAWQATVHLTAGSFVSSSGGKGGAGGEGASGGLGGPGATGAIGPTCTTGCVSRDICAPSCVSICLGAQGGGPGGAGGPGGKGGQGGKGGGGAGGPSYGTYVGGGGSITLSASPQIAAGSGGSSLGNGATGASKAQGP